MFHKKPEAKVGSALIQEAVAEFESIAARIESGVAHNRESAAANMQHIERLRVENAALEADAESGERVAAKLRALLS